MNALTEKELSDLKVTLVKEQPEYVAGAGANYSIEVLEKNGSYISATLYQNGKFAPGTPGFYAFKADDGWKIIFNGQETPLCSEVNALNFPKDMIAECWENNTTIKR
jgi:hypothetical protein